MAAKLRRPAVRFTLGPIQKPDYIKENRDGGRDSGAPSPENAPFWQPANVRLVQNQQRVKLLNCINDVLHDRAEHETSRGTLITLHDELKKKLRRKMEECFATKKMHLLDAKANTKSLLKEKEMLIVQIEKLNSHLLQHSQEHERHSQYHEEEKALKSTALNIINKSDKKPSRKADQKLAAGRLLREVQALRSRLNSLEKKLIAETRRKKQAEDELSILKAALTRQRGKRFEKVLKPLRALN